MQTAAGAFEAWVGRTERTTDVITPVPYAALAATLDREPALPAAGTPLPPLWHWLYFLTPHRERDLGPDGHARRGNFLPPVSLPRRMWAGSDVAFFRTLRVGDAVERCSTIESVVEKAGRSGALAFVRVRHDVTVAGDVAPALVERQTIVYRAASDARDVGAGTVAPPAPAGAAWTRRVVANDVLLFRYSALTFNGHRIHYDRRYVTDVEGYPGLVVHGPLVATLLLDLLRRERPDANVRAFAFRAIRPLFDCAPFHLAGAPSDDGTRVRLWASDDAGALATEATADLCA